MRRVITGVGPDGRSCVISDSGPERVNLMQSAGGSLFAGPAGPIDVPRPPAAGEAVDGLIWTSNGPDAVRLEGTGADDPRWVVNWHRTTFGPNTAAPLHATPTFDVDLVISGEIDLLLEAGDVHLVQGDTVVLPGVVHGWRTDGAPCDFICVMWSHPES